MAGTSITLTPTNVWDDGKKIHVIGTLAIGASTLTYEAGGILIPNPALAGVNAGAKPIWFQASGLVGYVFQYDRTNAKLIVGAQTSGASEDLPLGELAASAVPSALSGDTILFYAIYDKFI